MTQQVLALAAKEQYTMQDLLEIVALLRNPEGGCPWDKVQTHESIRRNFIEETYEVADAIDLGDRHLLCEELGDVLLQVALHTRMEEETGAFTFADVCTGICRKLIYRHPHVFGNTQADTPQAVLQNWEQLKRAEKHRERAADDLDSVPAALPALMRAGKVAKRAGQHGFACADAREAMDRLAGQVHALEQAVKQADKPAAAQQLGGALFAAADLARFLGCDAEETLEKATANFIRRFKTMECIVQKEEQASLEGLSAEKLATLWARANEVCTEC